MLFRPLIEKAIGSLMRTGMTVLGGYLIAQGLITEDQSLQLLALAPILAGLAWSLWQKYSSQVSMEVAKDMPAGATNAEIKQEVATMTLPEKVEKALTPAEPPPPVWPPPNEEDDAA